MDIPNNFSDLPDDVKRIILHSCYVQRIRDENELIFESIKKMFINRVLHRDEDIKPETNLVVLHEIIAGWDVMIYNTGGRNPFITVSGIDGGKRLFSTHIHNGRIQHNHNHQIHPQQSMLDRLLGFLTDVRLLTVAQILKEMLIYIVSP